MPRIALTGSTPWQIHKAQWGDGCGHALCAQADHVCLARGDLPCDVIFIGQCPGDSEDVLGQPFIGPAGALLDRIVARAIVPLCSVCGHAQEATPSGVTCRDGHGGADSRSVRLLFTNLVGCIPRDDAGRPMKMPADDQIRACRPRLDDLLRIARPRLVVRVGSEARRHVGAGGRHSAAVPAGCAVVDLDHPSHILQQPTAMQGMLTDRAEVILQSALEAL